jgi:CRISPR-associated protein Cas5h
MKVLIFDIKGDYAHYKKIYATTSAISYCIPPKTSMYGYIGAIIGLEKTNNAYLKDFADKQCLLGIGLQKPIVMQRINTNLRQNIKGTIGASENRKPTMVEYVYSPHYRIYFTHTNPLIYDALKTHVKAQTAVYTPTLGTANCISMFEYIDEVETERCESKEAVAIHSIVPRRAFINFDNSTFGENEIIEQSMFSLEMDTERNVTERDAMLLDRKAQPINLFVSHYYPIHDECNIVLF